MAEIHEDTQVPYAGWDRDCLKAARDRPDRRLGSLAGQRAHHGSTLRSGDDASRRPSGESDEVIALRFSDPAGERRKRFGR